MEAACIKLTEKCLSSICDLIKSNENQMTDVVNSTRLGCHDVEVICIADENTVDMHAVVTHG